MINLQKILRSKQKADNTHLYLWSADEVHDAMREAIRQALELAANEAKIIYDPIIDVRPEINKKSITSIINKVV